MVKNSPACSRFWKKKRGEPAGRVGFRRSSGCQRLFVVRQPPVLPPHEQQHPQSRRRFGQSPVTDRATWALPPWAGRTPRAGLGASRTRSALAPALTVPSRPGRAGARSSGAAPTIRRVSHEDRQDDRTSAANAHRHEASVVNSPPISGPAATPDRARRRHEPYARGRSAWPKLDATSATIAGRIRAAPTPSRNDHPIISTVRLGDSAVVNDPQP